MSRKNEQGSERSAQALGAYCELAWPRHAELLTGPALFFGYFLLGKQKKVTKRKNKVFHNKELLTKSLKLKERLLH